MGMLEGKVAIVTGAGRGVGRAEALFLAAEGAAVVVNDLGGQWDGRGQAQAPAEEVVSEIEELGGRAVPDFNDVASWKGAEALVEGALTHFGRLDLLVCNAGILRDRTLVNISEDEWDDVIRVHLKGHAAPSKFALAYWREASKQAGAPAGGRIVYTSSEAGLYGGNPGQSAYSAAKAGIAALTIVAAREAARYGVTVNGVCPRARTRMTELTFGEFEPVEGGFDLWDPAHVAPWVGYLCSDEAAPISGQVFRVWGDVVEWMQGWDVQSTVRNDGRRWELSQLAGGAAQALFGDRPTDPRPVPDVEIPVSSKESLGTASAKA